jgi:hypothetical protein
MPEPERARWRPGAWYRTHAAEAKETAALAVALATVQLWIEPLSLTAAGIALLLAVLLPVGTKPRNLAWSDFARRLPHQFAVIAVVAGLWRFAFSLPSRTLAFAPLWLALTALGVALRDGSWTHATSNAARLGRKLAHWTRANCGEWLGAELAVWGALFYVAARFYPDFWPRPWVPCLLLLAWVGGRSATRWHRPSARARTEVLRVVASALVFVGLMIGVLILTGRAMNRLEGMIGLWGVAGLLALRLGGRHRERTRGDAADELLRWLGVGLTGLWLLRGLAHFTLHGTADALWYATMTADAVAQIRAWTFPFWSGQSLYQFNGAIYPLRVAPAFLHLGALLDVLTLRAFGIFALQNLLLTLVGSAAILSAYVCLAALLPGRRWWAAGLAILFLACPGVLGMAYNTDLYMSWTTLPWIPVIWFASLRSFQDRGASSTLVGLGLALALCWWGHSPIALWSTLLAGIIQVVRLALQRPRGAEWIALALGAAAFVVVAAYPVGSVLLYPPERGVRADDFQRASPGTITYFLHEAFPGIFLPLSYNGRALADFQLGYALWLVLLLCVVCLWRRGPARAVGGALAVGVALTLALLLAPIPGLSLKLWTLVPALIRNTTGNWVMNRLYVPLAAAIVFAAASALGASAPGRPRLRRSLAIGLGVACLWSIGEGSRFVRGSRDDAPPAATAVDALRPENLKVTRFAYLIFPHWPGSFTHGVTDPYLENRLRARAGFAVISTNADAALTSGHEVASGEFVAPSSPSSYIELAPALRIESGRRYLLVFAFLQPDIAGVLQIFGPSLFREYGLPEYGGDTAFGAGGRHAHVIPVWTTTGHAEDLIVRFVPAQTGADPRSAAPFARVRLLDYDPAALPVRVTSWIPYRAEVKSPVPAWLETPRMFQDAYRAKVDGKSAQVTRSPEGLTAVAVPAGRSEVELVYRAPAGLQLLFWLSVSGMVAAGLALGTGSLRLRGAAGR